MSIRSFYCDTCYSSVKNTWNQSVRLLTAYYRVANESRLCHALTALTCWRHAVIPIPKPAKNASGPNNYRPIALTSCLCKVMERMINNRLVWFLEWNKLITPLQCGFRKQRSITDHLVRLESFIREAFIERQHAVAVFFDLEKAYDCTWKYGIMKETYTKQVCVIGSPALLQVS